MQVEGSREEKLYGLYAIMAKGDLKEDLVLPNCILLVGLTRVGKSAVYNWLTGKEMKSLTINHKRVFEQVADQIRVADVGHAPLSRTLIPNIDDISANTCIVDPAGFQDVRNHVGVYGVSYMLKIILQKCKTLQPIIVISQDQIANGSNVLQTLFQFVKLLDYSAMSEQTKKNLRESTALIITKANSEDDDEETIGVLAGLIDGWNHEDFHHQCKEQCIQILKHIVDTEKIGFFRKPKKVKKGQPESFQGPPKSTVLQEFKANEHTWAQFDLSLLSNEKITIATSFQSRYQRLIPTDKIAYQTAINYKIGAYNEASKIIRDTIDITIDQCCEKVINFEDIFTKLDKFIEDYDEYAPENKDISHRLNFTGLVNKLEHSKSDDVFSTMEKINRIMHFMNSLSQFNECQKANSNTREYMSKLSVLFKKCLIEMRDIVCLSPTEQQKFLHFSYILLRGFREFAIMSEIDPQHCNNPDIRIKDYLQKTKEKVIKKVSKLKPYEKIITFPRAIDIRNYLQFFNRYMDYMEESGNMSAEHSELMMKLVKDKLYQIQLLQEEEGQIDYNQLIIRLIEIMNDLIFAKELLCNEQESLEEENTLMINELNDSTHLCIKTLGQILLKKNLYQNALYAFKYIGDVLSTCGVYEKWCNDSEGDDKIALVNQYALWCARHGRISQAITILQRCVKEIHNTVALTEINNNIRDIIANRAEYLQEYCNQVQLWTPFYSREDDQDLKNILDELSVKIKEIDPLLH